MCKFSFYSVWMVTSELNTTWRDINEIHETWQPDSYNNIKPDLNR